MKEGFVKDAFGLASALLGWAPDTFWQATPFEFLAALKGYRRVHGLDGQAALDDADYAELKQRLTEANGM